MTYGTSNLRYAVNQRVLGQFDLPEADFDDLFSVQDDLNEIATADRHDVEIRQLSSLQDVEFHGHGTSMPMGDRGIVGRPKVKVGHVSGTVLRDEAPEMRVFVSSMIGRIVRKIRTRHTQILPQPRDVSEFEKILADLGRLKDGWAGPDSKSPSATVLRDAERLFEAFDANTPTPQVEVDSDDGHVAFFWQKGREAFSLLLNGKGSVTGILSPYQDDYRAWALPVTESDKIARRLAAQNIARLLAAG